MTRTRRTPNANFEAEESHGHLSSRRSDAGGASPVSKPDTVEVTFNCPPGGQLFTVNWDYNRKGSYSESGKRRDITFTGHGTSPMPNFSGVSVARSGQTIRCSYKSPQGYAADYSYTVNRQIISCPSRTNFTITCKLKDDDGGK